MGAAVRDQTDLLGFYAELAQAPYAHDFYQVMRTLECLFPDSPRWGSALRPAEEPIRLGQTPSMSFAPASIASFAQKEAGKPRLEVNFFGMLGPNGALPMHLTDYARQRLLHHGDETFVRFLDILHHRFMALFYRAWAQAQPTVSLDRPAEDRFSVYVASLIGLGQPSLRGRDAVPDHAKLFQAGALGRQIRNSEGLAEVLGTYFGLPVQVEQFVGHWMPIEQQDQSRLSACRLGQSAVVGRRVWDRQSKIRLRIGPMSLKRYLEFLPTGCAMRKLVDWVRFYTNGELFWDVQLVLDRKEVPVARLGRSGALGWSGWLAARQDRYADVEDLILDAERLADGRAAAA